jgi:hypothetical protein
MRGTIVNATQLYIACAVWLAVFVGSTTGYVRFADVALGALGIAPLLATGVILALGVATASAATWLVWSALGRERREPVRERRAAPAMDPA